MCRILARVRKGVRADGGFTLIELLIVVAIIGIIAAILIPNLIDALQKAKQKRTMADMKLVGTSWFSWLTDQYGAAAAGQSQHELDWNDNFDLVTFDELKNHLVPQYAAEVPKLDGWKNDFEFGQASDIEALIPVGLRSAGGDKEFDTDVYEIGSFVATDYYQDLVWAGGYFTRWPSGQP